MAALGGFEPQPLIAVGVSGGPDSLALMILADRWARQRGGRAWGLSVDHGLRVESAAEAKTVCGWLAARGIPHASLAWRGEKPATGIQEAARAARYRLLSEWCVRQGCLHLLTAHHRDDQVETYLIRRRAKSGPDGLAGMSAIRELAGLRLLRPLLGVSKARLIALLDAKGQPFLRDPSNRNPVFERARLRLAAEGAAAPGPASGEREGPAPQTWEDEGQPPQETFGEIHGHAVARINRERESAAFLARTVALHPAGFAAIDPALLARAADELAEQGLGRVAAVIGGAVYPLRRERLRRLRLALAVSAPRARTLGGCRFVPWRGYVLALREAARVSAPMILAPGDRIIWDHRFFATLPADEAGPVTIGALGTAGVAALDRDAVAADNSLPRLVYPVLPAVWDKAGLVAVPHLGWRRAVPAPNPELLFRPAAALFGAGFTVV